MDQRLVKTPSGSRTGVSAHRALMESLETRRLLSGFAASIDFAPAGSQPPAGWVADNGAVFGDRGNGLVYGWNGPRPAQVVAPRIRSKLAGPDERYDTFAVMHPRGRGS